MATNKRSGKLPEKSSSTPSTTLVHHMDALLNTVRCIAHHEDELCTLLHDARKLQTPDPHLADELRALLEKMPSHEYTGDLKALQSALGNPTPVQTRHPQKEKDNQNR